MLADADFRFRRHVCKSEVTQTLERMNNEKPLNAECVSNFAFPAEGLPSLRKVKLEKKDYESWDEEVFDKEDYNTENEKIIIETIEEHIAKGNYSEAYGLIENGKFSEPERMIAIWDDAHYAEKEKQINKPLTPLMKFRIRQRYIPPVNICPSRERPTLSLPQRAKRILCTWYDRHKENPFPSKTEKDELASTSGLTLTQVQTWFANLRRRKHCRHLHTCQKEKSFEKSNEVNQMVSSDSDLSNKVMLAAEGMMTLSKSPPPTEFQSIPLSSILKTCEEKSRTQDNKLPEEKMNTSIPPLLPVPKPNYLRYVPARYPSVLPVLGNFPCWIPTVMAMPMPVGIPLNVYPTPLTAMWEEQNQLIQHLQKLQNKSFTESVPE